MKTSDARTDFTLTNHIFGIDPSLRSTGWAVVSQIGALVDFGAIVPGDRRGVDRWEYIVDNILIAWAKSVILPDETPRLAFIENYPMGIGRFFGAGRIFDLAEIGGVIKYRLWKDLGVRTVPIATQTAKKAATGSGRATKEQVSETLRKVFPALTTGRKMDETDAVAIALAGRNWIRVEDNVKTVWEERR